MPVIPIADITVRNRHRKTLTGIDRLAASIEEVGLLQPIVVTPENRLVSGFRRIKAFTHLGRESIPAVIAKNLTEAILLLKAERDENTCREPFTIEEAVAMGESIEAAYRPKAKEKRAPQEHGKKGGRPKKTDRKSLPNGSKPKQDESARTTSQAAEGAGMSRPTYEKAKAVIDAAKEDPTLRPLVDEMNKSGKVSGVAKKLGRIQAAEEIRREPQPLPTGPFRVLVVDPPWRYTKRDDDPTHRATCPYPSMTVDEIAALPVGNLAGDDAILWLWTTNAHLPEVWPIISSWGFAYKTMLTWVKDKMGVGDWLRGQTEHCLLCVKGKPTTLLTNQTTVIHAPAREHSRKPEAFYLLVEELCPGSKCELFARESREGWTVWGNEIG